MKKYSDKEQVGIIGYIRDKYGKRTPVFSGGFVGSEEE